MSRPENNNFDPYTAERAFSFQIGDRAAELYDSMPPSSLTVEVQPIFDQPKLLGQQAVQGAFENPYVVTRPN